MVGTIAKQITDIHSASMTLTIIIHFSPLCHFYSPTTCVNFCNTFEDYAVHWYSRGVNLESDVLQIFYKYDPRTFIRYMRLACVNKTSA